MKHNSILLFFLCILFNCIFTPSKGSAQIVIKSTDEEPVIIGRHLKYLIDKSNSLAFKDIIHSNFQKSNTKVLSFGLNNDTYWLKFEIKNISNDNNLFLEIKNPTLTNVFLYTINGDKIAIQHSGESVAISDRTVKTQNPLFFITLDEGETKTYFFKIQSKKILSFPIFLGKIRQGKNILNFDEYLFFIYFGIILIMIFYNFFIFLSVRDKDYLYYILYIFWVGITQAGLQGYTFRFLWPNNIWLTEQSTNFFIAMSGISSILFIKSFLNVKRYYRSINTIFTLSLLIFLACIIINLAGYLIISQKVIQVTTLITTVIIIVCGILIQRKGNRAALFFNISWSFFLLSIIVYILKDIEVLPYTVFTYNSILIGSAVEIALLSFALADKINIYKIEKEISQEVALQTAKDKEYFVREQNILLEGKVSERTTDLQRSNQDLSEALHKLQNAQVKLIEAEKMSSLGQLTAGIAHEINNPINFVKSNIRPLKLDIQDLTRLVQKYQALTEENIKQNLPEINAFKEEIDLDYLNQEIEELLNAIEDGATRTADIVQGLQTFSRLDEDEIKRISVFDGIDATLVLLRNLIPPNLMIIKNYNAIPSIECYPGKLNQVFMNIFTNAIQAIKAKPNMQNESITITTESINEHINIHISDTGVGISEGLKTKIFDPFFTTKEVGEGTGLGLSIVFSIIEKHHGHITLHSEEGKGAEFIITLPVDQP